MTQTTPGLPPKTDAVHVKKTGQYQNPIALCLTQERAVTHFSTFSLPIFPKPVVTLWSVFSIPPTNMATVDQLFQKLLVNM